PPFPTRRSSDLHRPEPGLGRGFQGEPEADGLPLVDLLIVRFEALAARDEPPAGAADRAAVPQVEAVVLEGVHPFGEGGPHLADGGPPVVVVPPQEEFPAREAADEGEIVRGFLQGHGPRDVPRHQDQIVGAHPLPPAGGDLGRVVPPDGIEDVHGFLLAAGQVKVGQREELHPRSLPGCQDRSALARPGPGQKRTVTARVSWSRSLRCFWPTSLAGPPSTRMRLRLAWVVGVSWYR